jgi:transcription antitermination protein NusB
MAVGNKRANARLAAVQALYQMDVTGKGINEIFAEFETYWIGQEIEGEQYRPAELAFFRDTVSGVLKDQMSIDQMVDSALVEGWPLTRIEALMRAILRAGTYELKKRKDIPPRVSISEYVDVASAFFAREESGMINAVLDVVGRRLRSDEFVK